MLTSTTSDTAIIQAPGGASTGLFNSRYDDLAQLCKASADPLRLQILRVLKSNSFGVLELCSIFETKQSGMSHHLKVLAKASLVTTRREGNSIFYRRTLSNLEQLGGDIQQSLFATLDNSELTPETRTRVEEIKQQRALNSRNFFAKHANKFREQQELIADYQQYADSARDLLISDGLPAKATAIEIGPGEGAFLQELSPHFEHVYAIDNSREMLQKAQAFSDKLALSNIEFLHGTSTLARSLQIKADAIIINMVLHHAPSPEELFEDASALLKPGGRLIITDLCLHDQSWVREACGDLWLGFDPDEFTRWANNAGLDTGNSLFLGQRNGFQVQVRRFHKPLHPSSTTRLLTAEI